MSYPRSPNFDAGENNAAWWLIRREIGGDVFPVLCQADGRTFAEAVQYVLQTKIPSSGLRTYDNTTIRGADVVIDGKWGTKTMKGIYALLKSVGGPQSFMDAAKSSAQYRTIGRATLGAGIWLLHYANPAPGEQAGLRQGSIYLSADVVPMRWATAPTPPPGWTQNFSLNCAIERTPQVALPADWGVVASTPESPPTPSPPIPNTADNGSATTQPDQSSSDMNVPQVDIAVRDQGPIESITPTKRPVPWIAIGAAVSAIAIAGAVTYFVMKRSGKKKLKKSA